MSEAEKSQSSSLSQDVKHTLRKATVKAVAKYKKFFLFII